MAIADRGVRGGSVRGSPPRGGRQLGGVRAAPSGSLASGREGGVAGRAGRPGERRGGVGVGLEGQEHGVEDEVVEDRGAVHSRSLTFSSQE